MFMKLHLGKDSTFVVKSCVVSLYSRGDLEKVDDCEPGEISLTVRIPLDATKKQKLGGAIYKFGSDQDDAKKTDLKGKIEIYMSADKTGQPKGDSLHTIEFEHAWLGNLTSSFSEGSPEFDISTTILASKIIMSGCEFANQGRWTFVDKHNPA